LYGAETLAIHKVDQEYLGSFEMWCRRGEETISWTNHVRYEVFHRVKQKLEYLTYNKQKEG
jgi:hypothetical protein